MLTTFALTTAMVTPFIASCRSPHPLVIKQSLASIAARTTGGANASPSDVLASEELIQLLEAYGSEQPVRNWAARGPTLAGEWEQIYTDNVKGSGTVKGNGSWSRRKLIGPLSGRVLQIIDYEEPFGREIPPKFAYRQRARGRKRALGLQAEMSASIEPQDDGITWRVSFEEFAWSLFYGRLTLRKRSLPEGSGGTWKTTYLDADTRVLRSENNRGGAPTVYLLRRVGGAPLVPPHGVDTTKLTTWSDRW